MSELCDALNADLSVHALFILQDPLAAFAQAEERIKRYDAFIRERPAPYRDQVDLLVTFSGVDQDPACAIAIGPDPNIRAFSPLQPIPPRACLCSVPVECAHCAAATSCNRFKGIHKILTVHRGYQCATVATEHRMLCCIHTMLRSAAAWHDPETDYESRMVRRNDLAEPPCRRSTASNRQPGRNQTRSRTD